ncbi:hypothetical protein A2W24_01135 [Microgenomates group bacterium RBG_16_45_19]|nr:MAG: hypothetical protein A2W24_01135 [Microgenomates group bacterium RBG_16_45_19]
MGRYSWSDRDTVEDCKCVDIPWLAEHGYFGGYNSGTITWTSALSGKSSIGIEVYTNGGYGGDYIRFRYTQSSTLSGEKSDLDYTAQLVTTPCNYGGVRYWFICPLVVSGQACNRRVSKLYLPPGGKYFGCRTCHNLTYRSCKEHDKKVDSLIRNPARLAALLQEKDPTQTLFWV